MPMALRPATTATRADSALIERAMSSASPMTRDDLIPGAGSSSYRVTTGPGFALTISPRPQIAHRACDVVGKPDDARRFDSRRRLQLVQGNHRARIRLDDLAAHTEIAEHAFQCARIGVELGLAQG